MTEYQRIMEQDKKRQFAVSTNRVTILAIALVFLFMTLGFGVDALMEHLASLSEFDGR